MSDILLDPAQPTINEDAEFKQIMDEICRLNESMRQDQIEIASIKTETEQIKQEAARYKAETAVLKAQHSQWYQEHLAQGQEIRALLEKMKAAVSSC